MHSLFLMHGIVGGRVGTEASARASASRTTTASATAGAADERVWESASTPASAAEPTQSVTRTRDRLRRLGRDVVVVDSWTRGASPSMSSPNRYN